MLLELDQQLLDIPGILAEEKNATAAVAEQPGAWDRLHTALQSLIDERDLLAAWRADLKKVAKSGSGEACNPAPGRLGITLAQVACLCHRFELVKELVRRGADPNQGIPHTETLFQTAIICQPWPHVEKEYPPVEERLELLDFLLEHGANVNGDSEQESNQTLILAYMSACMDSAEQPDAGLMLEYLLDNGLTLRNEVDIQIIASMLRAKNTLPALHRIIFEKKTLNADDHTLHFYALLAALGCPEPDALRKLSWVLDVLGVDPNIVDDPSATPPRAAYTSALFELRTATALEDEEENRIIDNSLTALDMMLARGLQLTPQTAQSYLPRDPIIRERYLEILSRYGVQPSE